MNLDRYVEDIHAQLDAAAEASGEESRTLAKRLAAPLDSAIRLALQDALAAAAEEITVDLAPGSVELRLRGREFQFVVTLPPAEPSLDEAMDEDQTPIASHRATEGEETISRINLRMPEHLKARVEQAAEGEGLSVNSWLVQAAAARLERRGGARGGERRAHGAQRYTGWAR